VTVFSNVIPIKHIVMEVGGLRICTRVFSTLVEHLAALLIVGFEKLTKEVQ
jgi:hypothetical protein